MTPLSTAVATTAPTGSVADRRPVVAFYAPLKPPAHPNPSGDRLLARLLLQALEQAGFSPQLACGFRSYEGAGDHGRQLRLKVVGQRLAQRLIRRYQRLPESQRPSLWFTYHLYHKAPDWIGPLVSRALNIPYVVAEASYAHKQTQGRWQLGLADSARALHQAAAILCLNPADRGGIEQCRANAPLHSLPPFLDLAPFKATPVDTDKAAAKQQLARRYQLDPKQPWLICVAMMRPGDKQHSYRLLAEALHRVGQRRWQLLIIGDGSVRAEVEAYFNTAETTTEPQIHFMGRLTPDQIRPLLQASDLYLWPAVNEAFGMALLEAQAAGTAVLAGDEGGVGTLIEAERSGWLVAARDSHAFAKRLDQLLQQPGALSRAGAHARARVEQQHSLAGAGQRLQQLLGPLITAPVIRDK